MLLSISSASTLKQKGRMRKNRKTARNLIGACERSSDNAARYFLADDDSIDYGEGPFTPL
jgi:hypothetical protein